MTFDVYLDEVGKVIVNDLCKSKKKLEKKEADLKKYTLIFILAAVVFVSYVALFTIIPFWNQYSLMISNLIGNVYHYFFIGAIVTSSYWVKYVAKKADKAEKEFHALRCEVIQKVEQLWPVGDQWNNRHIFFREMKDKYNINLYYENSK